MTRSRVDERLLFLAATLTEMADLCARGREVYDSDIAVARACQFGVIRLAADLERLGDDWLSAPPEIPLRLIKGMRNRIAHNYWLVDDDVVWSVVETHAPELHRQLSPEIDAARKRLGGETVTQR
ncbi:DUF86 domain-containing protein [Nocardia sp. BSTN01]|uniref:HepT-like ribonuclease domain-containing protein n=1 Tax=Nocardia sp. BSTN01 TaxID=2783665 RepID=UPI0018903CCB|nr:HepT-like ribonuclease domain-containing protein [Nocardia sp. BSTN01]MBF4998858.1 DUF86 domain-containing protein [Nocardia sp. BSTN01]